MKAPHHAKGPVTGALNDYACGGGAAMHPYLSDPSVVKALHVKAGTDGMRYGASGGWCGVVWCGGGVCLPSAPSQQSFGIGGAGQLEAYAVAPRERSGLPRGGCRACSSEGTSSAAHFCFSFLVCVVLSRCQGPRDRDDLRPLYKTLALKYRVAIYSGDVDGCVPYVAGGV